MRHISESLWGTFLRSQLPVLWQDKPNPNQLCIITETLLRVEKGIFGHDMLHIQRPDFFSHLLQQKKKCTKYQLIWFSEAHYIDLSSCIIFKKNNIWKWNNSLHFEWLQTNSFQGNFGLLLVLYWPLFGELLEMEGDEAWSPRQDPQNDPPPGAWAQRIT